ncbi:hypothetical protein BDQ12DRAFT_684517 [Crucibulum laeve]|uniref:CNH domain-containing protein n=1 Tax=Crucibulum laeve TaxID=68775 RepID=A0A5C3LYJ4_9AGAR|nr:hypothetical protein BDQ12DRAFT_684517 [Crucibulum laeve]
MSNEPSEPKEIPAYQIQHLISNVVEDFGFEQSDRPKGGPSGIQVRCAQALGSEIYVGCSNGELIRYALQADDPNRLESYSILSRQTLPNERPIDEIVLIPSISRALILSDRQLHFYILPSLDPVPTHMIKPIRNVVTFAVDNQHLKRPALPPGSSAPLRPVEFCVIKRNSIAMFTLTEKLFYQKEIPLPNGGTHAKRNKQTLCVADKQYYNMVDLEGTLLFPLLPLSQSVDPLPFEVKPHIMVIDDDFLLTSWTGTNTLGLFVTPDGDPVRGTLEWVSYPDSITLDYPYINTLLPNGEILIHHAETQALIQTIYPGSETDPDEGRRLGMVASLGGYLIPSKQRSQKMQMVSVKLLRGGIQEVMVP